MKNIIIFCLLFSAKLYSQSENIKFEIISESKNSGVMKLPILDSQDRILGIHSQSGWELYYSESIFDIDSKFLINSYDAVSGNFESKRIAILHKEPLGYVSPDHSPNEYYLSVFNFESELIFTTAKIVCTGILPEIVVSNNGSVFIIGGEKKTNIIKKFSPIGEEIWYSIIQSIGLRNNIGLSANQKYVWAFNSKLRIIDESPVNSFFQVLSMSDGSLLVDQENKETLEDIVWKENEEVIIFSNELIKCYHFKENNFEESNDMYFPVDGSNNRITGIWNFQQNNFIAYVPQVGKEKFLCSKKTEPKNLKEIFHNIDSLPIQWAYLDVKGFARIKTEKSDYVIKMD